MPQSPPEAGDRRNASAPVQRWRAARLLDAPHRLCFFWAGLNWALSAAWWAVQLPALEFGAAWPWLAPPAAVHGLLFATGAMPLFIAGFVLTAGPRWLRLPPVAARGLRWPVASYSAGWALALGGFQLDARLAGAGLALAAAAWSALTLRLLRLIAASEAPDRRHLVGVALACVAIAGCLAASSLAMLLSRPEWLAVTSRLGLWSVAAVFLLVSHRLLPFLGEGAWARLDARWPDWTLWLVISVPLLEGVAALVDPWHPASRVWSAVQAVLLAVVASLCLRLALHFRRQPALRQPLVAMLYVAFVWWDVSLWLGAASRWPGLSAGASAALETARVHTLALGFLGGTLLAMATRVSAAHSGRPQPIDTPARWLYRALQATLVCRLVPLLWAPSGWLLLPLAACAWAGIAVIWALRHGRWAGCPRVDGRPG